MSTFSTCTSTTRPGSPTDGDVLFETDTKNVIIWDGTSWRGYQNDGISIPGVSNTFSGSFDGTNDYISIPTISELNAPTNWSFACWFRYQGTPSGSSHVLASAGSSSSNRFYIQLTSTSNIRFGNDAVYNDISISTVNNTTWYHLAVVQSGTSAGVYLNGSSQGSATVNSANTGWGTSFRIGQYFSGGFSWSGYLDEVALWDVALDADDASSLYNNGLPIDLSSAAAGYDKQADLTHWWRIGDHASDTGSGGSPSSGDTISNVENAANPNTNDGTGNGPIYSTTVPS